MLHDDFRPKPYDAAGNSGIDCISERPVLATLSFALGQRKRETDLVMEAFVARILSGARITSGAPGRLIQIKGQ